jgi:hypothetical protein
MTAPGDDDDKERPLPALPTLSADSSMDGTPDPEAIPTYHPSPTPSHANTSHSTDAPSSAGSIFEDPPSCAMIMNRTPVLFTSNTARAQQLAVPPSVPASKIPRGPRGPRTSAHVKTQSTGSTIQSSTSTVRSDSTQTAALSVTTPAIFKPSLIPVGQRDALRSTAGTIANARIASTASLAKCNVGQTPTPSRRSQKRVTSSSSAKSAITGSVSSRRSAAKTPRPRTAHASSSKENTQDENAYCEFLLILP